MINHTPKSAITRLMDDRPGSWIGGLSVLGDGAMVRQVLGAGLCCAAVLAASVTAAADDELAGASGDGRDDPPASAGSDGPNLDELLGIDEGDESDAARRQSREELERVLSEQEVSDTFTQAVDQMKLSADMLGDEFDAGVGTQRVQEEIIAKLDMLIENADRQPPSSGDSGDSGGDADSADEQQEQEPGERPQQDRADQQDQQGGDEEGDGDAAGDGPPPQQPDIDQDIEETRAQWGNLPDRVRDMMLQGQSGTYSSLYRTLTEEYYRRLAEESSDD